jgi:hypothetical protein
MTPIFIYRLPSGSYLVRSLNNQDVDDIKGIKLVASIDAAPWLQWFLNGDATNRRRMIRQLEGK